MLSFPYLSLIASGSQQAVHSRQQLVFLSSGIGTFCLPVVTFLRRMLEPRPNIGRNSVSCDVMLWKGGCMGRADKPWTTLSRECFFPPTPPKPHPYDFTHTNIHTQSVHIYLQEIYKRKLSSLSKKPPQHFLKLIEIIWWW